MKFHKKFELQNIQSTAKELLEFADNKRVFLFYGSMGAGKTTLIKALCQALGVEQMASSPTFSIVNEYATQFETIYHFDFYRIKREEEAYDLGFEEYLYSGAYCFIEWPEKVENLLSQDAHTLRIQLDVLSPESRVLSAN